MPPDSPSFRAPPPDDDFETLSMHYADGSTREVRRRRRGIQGQHPQLVIMDEAANMKLDDSYTADGIFYFPVVIPGVGWFWRCGMCHALVGDGGDLNAIEPDTVSAHAHSQGAHAITTKRSGTMLTMDRGDLAAAIKDWADTQEVGRCDPHALADLIRDTKWPFE